MFIKQLIYRKSLLLYLVIFSVFSSFSQQQPDTTFVSRFDSPNFTAENAPVIFIDKIHNNLHQLNTGFSPFAGLAEADGYMVKNFDSYSRLTEADMLVIVNPINKKNMGNWKRPIYPAFEEAEKEKIRIWVENGGNLLLIADHMPFAGAAKDLAQSFGFNYCDGFAQLAEKENRNDVFSQANGRLPKSPVTDGTYGEVISKLTSFTGSSFKIPEAAIPVMSFKDVDKCLQPEIAWQFNDSTQTSDLSNSHQGALMNYGKGKLAIFGEAAMFTAQTITQNGNTFKVGFNSATAPNNVQFVRNILLWLADGTENGENNNSVTTEILAVNRQMEATFDRGDYEDISEFYSEDGVMLGNNTEVIGRENLREYWSRFGGGFKWRLSNIEIKELDGDYALQRGFSIISWKNDNEEISESKVIFSLLWKKTDQGWKIMLDHYSPR
ncbi:YybH family protein [Christiangramia sediminis]|uniref:Nuclear transport factor 2 family protein n=1 Tax=Christiangramia sediminis TaxID=2881336 RepID=A0A9X1LG70_9FLAO|nr:SgcJ/EcaC family oxidoreductase [Christiangramia sediminis]MCB7479805.1 nuclear transport factor 2 family protein [Christiangramia sediminis]